MYVSPNWLALCIFFVPSLIVWLFYKNLKVPSEKQYLTFCPRFWASFVDSLAVWPLHTILDFIQKPDSSVWLLLTVSSLRSLLWIIYSIYLHGTYGQTIGKMVTRVKIVDTKTHNPISFRHAIMRDSIPTLFIIAFTVYHAYYFAIGTTSIPPRGLALLTSMFLLWYAVELFTMLTNEKRRALHDFIAGTLVVRTNIETPESEDLQ